MQNKIAIDLGASRVVVGAPREELLSGVRPSFPLKHTDGTVLGFGEEIDRIGSTGGGEVAPSAEPKGIAVVSENTKIRIADALKGAAGDEPAALLLGIPCSFSEVEEIALAELAVEAGAGKVYLLYSPIAALLGNDLDVSSGAVIVDIGAHETNMIAISHGRILYKKTYAVGGASFDRAISDYILKCHGVKIDPKMAEDIKIGIGTVWVGNERRTQKVQGRDLSNGDYCIISISSEEMFTALEEPMASVIEGVCETVTHIPSDCVQEIFKTGILLSGGGCLLEGIDKMISGVTGVNTSRLAQPRIAVTLGMVKLLSTDMDLEAAGTCNVSRYVMKNSTKRGWDI